MTHEEFDKFQQEVFEQLLIIGRTKGREYANSDSDRFANFKQVAAECGTTKYQVLWTYVKKHIRAMDSFIQGNQVLSNEDIRSRARDIALYMILMMGMITEENKAAHAYAVKLTPDGYGFEQELPRKEAIRSGNLPAQAHRIQNV